MFDQQGLPPGFDSPQGVGAVGTDHPSPPRAPNWPPVPMGPPSPFPIQNPTGYPGGWEQGAAHGSKGGGWGGDNAWHGVVAQERGAQEIRTAGGGRPGMHAPNFQDAGLNASGVQPPQQGGLNSPAALANAVRAAGAARMA